MAQSKKLSASNDLEAAQEISESSIDQSDTATSNTEKKIKQITITNFFDSLKSKEFNDAEEWAKISLENVISNHKVAESYNILLLHDDTTLVRSDADSIYKAIEGLEHKKNILLVVCSSGGHIERAYLISQLCREYSKNKFVVVVPRRAKSAASLICCGADEIHLGSMSELGPIDPQIDDQPALGLGNALERIASMVTKYPAAANMFSDYLVKTVIPINIGYYERVTESATQYAERLLQTHSKGLSNTPGKIANDLVYSYKDHGFLIDKNEALKIFGDGTVKINTPEYELGNAIYNHLSFISAVCDMNNIIFHWVGSPSTNCSFRERKRKSQ